MSKKLVQFREEGESPSLPISSLPNFFRFKNITNQQQPSELHHLRERIEELQQKVSQLQNRIKTKRKRIRRKSNEVDKRYKCENCKKLYGSLVSLNLHLRIKHRKQRGDKKEMEEQNKTFAQ